MSLGPHNWVESSMVSDEQCSYQQTTSCTMNMEVSSCSVWLASVPPAFFEQILSLCMSAGGLFFRLSILINQSKIYQETE